MGAHNIVGVLPAKKNCRDFAKIIIELIFLLKIMKKNVLLIKKRLYFAVYE